MNRHLRNWSSDKKRLSWDYLFLYETVYAVNYTQMKFRNQKQLQEKYVNVSMKKRTL